MTAGPDPVSEGATDVQGVPDDVEAVERLPLPERPQAYLAVEQALQERLGLGGP